MLNLQFFILILAIIIGQVVKFSLGSPGGITILDMVLIILILFNLKDFRLSLKKTPFWIKAAFFYITIALISLIFSPLSLTSYEYFISGSYLIRFSLFIIFGLTLLNKEQHIQKYIFRALFLSGIGLAILGILQLIIFPDLSFLSEDNWDPHYFRVVSTFLDPNFLGAYFSLTLILTLLHPSLIKKWRIVIFTLVFLALLLTFSRGAYLGFAGGFFTLAFLKKSKEIFILTLLLSTVLIIGFIIYQILIAQPRNIERDRSAGYRFNTWQQGLNLFQKHPILGVGFNSYKYALREYHLGSEKFLETRGASANDSSILHVAATTGIVGLFAYLLFIFSIIKLGWQNYLSDKISGTILLTGLATLFLQSFFSNTLFYPHLLIWLIIILVLSSLDTPIIDGKDR